MQTQKNESKNKKVINYASTIFFLTHVFARSCHLAYAFNYHSLIITNQSVNINNFINEISYAHTWWWVTLVTNPHSPKKQKQQNLYLTVKKQSFALLKMKKVCRNHFFPFFLECKSPNFRLKKKTSQICK